jgi:predicted porin
MQKKLIALAVAGLASTVTFAQTNVTIYGVVDYGYAYRWDGRNLSGSGSTPNSQSQLNSGQELGNRIGFKGTEDLGNGMKALFQLEQGFLLDTGNQQVSGNQFNRQAYAGLSGNFGSIVGGRMYTPFYTLVVGLDPFQNGTVGAYQNAWSPAQSFVGVGGSLMNPIRVDNAIAYVSPTFGGFSITGAFSNNFTGQESSTSNAANNTVYDIMGTYSNGPLFVGANYHYIAAGSNPTVAAIDNAQNATLAGSYDFKVAKLMALYSWNNVEYNDVGPNGNGDISVNNYMLGVTVPYGKWTGKASYLYSDGNRSAGGDAQQLAVGADYHLSKRTNFYTAYSWIDNSSNRMGGVGDASNVGSYGSGATAGVWQQGFQVGLRHTF